MYQYGLLGIVCTSPRVKVLDPGGLDGQFMNCLDSVRCDGGIWEMSIGVYLRGKSEGLEPWKFPARCIRIYLRGFHIHFWVGGSVHVSGSWTIWFGSQRFCSSRGRDPTNSKNLEDISTLEVVCEIVLGVKSKPPSVWGICRLVTTKS